MLRGRGIVFLMVVGCGAPPAAPPPSPAPVAAPVAAPEPEVAMAPTPYTAEEIRAATSEGRRYEWKVEEGSTEYRAHIAFSDVAEAGTVLVSAKAVDGKMETEDPTSVTWEELREHALFPAAVTTITEEAVDLPAGHFECMVYRVERDGAVETFYFAKELPGAPVQYHRDQGGQRVETRRLVAHDPGGG